MILSELRRLSSRHASSGHVWAALAFVGAASAGWAAAADGDIWWHLAAGREMWARGGWLMSDPFSSGAAGRPWVDVHWLFQLGAYAIHARLGLAGLVVCKCLLVGGGAIALVGAVRGERLAAWTRPLLVTLLVAALVAARSLLLVRPVIVTLLCVALFFRELERFRVDPAPGRIVRLALVQLVWSNCQGLSAIGPALAGAYAAAAGLHAALGARASWPFASEGSSGAPLRFQRLLLAVAACAAASLATPFGWRGVELSTSLFERLVPGRENVYAHSIAENVPPFLFERWSGGELWHLEWAFALLGLALLAGGRRLRLSHALVLLGFGGLALLANRNVLLFYWVAAPIAALHLASAARRLARRVGARLGQRLGRRVVLGANALALGGVLGVSTVAAAHEPSLAEPSPFRAPVESARLLAERPGQGSLFAADHYGGYLIWQLYPRFRPYIDTRLVLRSAAEYAEYLELADEPERFDAFQQKHGFRYVVLPTAFPDRYLALIGHLYRSPDWKLVYTDGSEVLFAHTDLATSDLATSAWDLGAAPTTDELLAGLATRHAGQPDLLAAAHLHLATLQIVVGQGAQAERVLSALRAVSTLRSDEADALLARARFAAGDLDGARAVAERQLARDADDVRSLSLLSQIALTQGDLADGLSLARRALRVDPFDAEATSIFDRLREVPP
jgi:tetratricopeptide (TPR) repeat protein